LSGVYLNVPLSQDAACRIAGPVEIVNVSRPAPGSPLSSIAIRYVVGVPYFQTATHTVFRGNALVNASAQVGKDCLNRQSLTA